MLSVEVKGRRQVQRVSLQTLNFRRNERTYTNTNETHSTSPVVDEACAGSLDVPNLCRSSSRAEAREPTDTKDRGIMREIK